MSAREDRSIILGFLTIVVALSLPSTGRPQHSREFLANSAHTQRVDGGGPIPPLPPTPFLNTLTPDGGGPVPPLPPARFFSTLTVDGGGPVPPLPPSTSASLSSHIQLSPLLADGGGPVPPLPPTSFLNTLTADGGGPVPPLPPLSLPADFVAA
jgi:hypothetical protein